MSQGQVVGRQSRPDHLKMDAGAGLEPAAAAYETAELPVTPPCNSFTAFA